MTGFPNRASPLVCLLASSFIGLVALGACAVPLAEVQPVNATAEAEAAPKRAIAQQAFVEQCEAAISGGLIDRKALRAAGFAGPAVSDPQSGYFVAPLAVGTNVMGKTFDLTFTGFIADRNVVPPSQSGSAPGGTVPSCSSSDLAFQIAPRHFASKGYSITPTGRGTFLMQRGSTRALLINVTTIHGTDQTLTSVEIKKLP